MYNFFPSRLKSGAAQVRAALSGFFADREIIVRTEGNVRYVYISRRFQIIAASIAGGGLLLGGSVTATLIFQQSSLSRVQAAIAAQSRAVDGKASAVAAYRKSVGDVADDLEARQDFIDDLAKSYLGTPENSAAVVGQDDGKAMGRTDAKAKISFALPPVAQPLKRVAERQRRFAQLLTVAVERRTRIAEDAIRSFGFNPRTLTRDAAMGGPFVPWKGERDALSEELKDLSAALARMDMLERTLVAIPSGKPTATPMLSSSYGYRRDPFNGHAAFHAGLDFPGSYGQPILAAARGRVVYVGQRQGYGNVVEVDHGNGLMTRYAHLSRFGTQVGATVQRGEAIARMGSTGRSTGTHLHFEVRQNGAAINPRRFLEADADVLQVQQIAKQRFADINNRRVGKRG